MNYDVSDEKIPQLFINRPALTLAKRNEKCSYQTKRIKGSKENLKSSLKKTCSCSKEKLWKIVTAKLPILGWLIGYDWKNWLVGDLIAGVTIAIIQIPIGMGFALLANVPPICGIYMAFYPVLIYAILSTSMHNSMGAFAVITLMTGKVVNELATFPASNVAAGVGVANISESIAEVIETTDITYTPIQVATVVCFMVGVWQTLFGLLQLGSLSVFLSDMLVSGFTTAAAFHVITSQIKDLLGIKIAGISGPFKIIYIYKAYIDAIPSVNIATLILSLIAMTVMIINNEIIKPKVAKYVRIPIPIEFMVVIICTVASYFGDFYTKYDMKVVGHISTGLPPPSLPPLELYRKVAVDSFVIAVVAYTISYSVAKIIAMKRGYVVDATQELYAQGLGNVFSSFFSCPPMAAALVRSLIQEAVGGMTQLASLINCVLILFVLLFLGPLFETLPRACLAAIISVALKGMFMQAKHPVEMWKVSPIESITWLVTFFATVIIDIDYGLLVGVIFSLFVLLAKNQKPSGSRLGRVPNTDIYLDIQTFPQTEELDRISIYRLIGAIHFANRENIRTAIIKGTGLDPSKKKLESQEKNFLLLDMSGISSIDSGGCKFLDRLRSDYEKVNVILCMAGLTENVYNILDKSGSLENFSSNNLYHSVHDAVTILTFY